MCHSDAALNDYLSEDNIIAAGLLDEVQYVCILGQPEYHLHALMIEQPEHIVDMFDAPDLRGDVLYKRDASGRVTRILW